MAYIDQSVGRRQRLAVMAIAGAIQAAAIVALIHGFTVTFIKTQPDPNPQAPQIPLTPPPMPKDLPPPKPPVEQEMPRNPLPPRPLPPIGGTIIEMPPVPQPPAPMPTQAYTPPEPLPSPAFTPRAAKPRGAPGNWATPNDYPSRDLREGNQGVTGFALEIGTDGKVQSCTVTRGSGFPGLDKATCDNVARRARFEPASDGSGARIPGSYRGSISWRIPRD